MIKVLPTDYNGTKYRSRTEAIWAAYFSFLSVDFSYEPEGFDLGPSGYYLPDFYLPRIDSFVEIKPEFIVDGRDSPCEALANETGKRVVLIQGRPMSNPDNYPTDTPTVFFPNEGVDFPYYPIHCRFCGWFGFGFSGWAERLGCKCKYKYRKEDCSNTPPIKQAIDHSVTATRWKP